MSNAKVTAKDKIKPNLSSEFLCSSCGKVFEVGVFTPILGEDTKADCPHCKKTYLIISSGSNQYRLISQ